MKITISEIKVNPGRRPINLDGISELARSISEIGLPDWVADNGLPPLRRDPPGVGEVDFMVPPGLAQVAGIALLL